MDVVLDIRNRIGSAEHYYHFMLGFLAPLLQRVEKAGPDEQFLVRSCGPMDVHLATVAGPSIRIIPKDEHAAHIEKKRLKVERLMGFDGPANYNAAAFMHMRQVILHHFAVRPAASNDGSILLVQRGKSPDYYQSEQAELKLSANLRRSLPNIVELEQAIATCGRRAEIVELENATMAEQVALFARAGTVVAQHGAALLNMLWMQGGGTIIEINPKKPENQFVDCFRDFAKICGHTYHCIRQANQHAKADPAELIRALRADEDVTC